MKSLSEIAKKYSYGEIRVTHEQNLVLPHVLNSNLYSVWTDLKKIKLATANIGLITDTICCPGMDYCALATARSIPISQKISQHFKNQLLQKKIGKIKIKISGCINACGHHHVGNIGILGLDKNGEESYQISLGGSADEKTNIGQIVGPSFTEDKLISAIETIIKTYEDNRLNLEDDFISVFNRVGIDKFKQDLYEKNNS
jgi:sulfite reductase (NADPH) hemoprotein beta-component